MTFRFESLLRLRKNAEHLEQREMARMQTHLHARQSELNNLKNSGEKNRNELQGRLQKSLPGRTLELYDRYFQSVKTRSGDYETVISETHEKVEAKRRDLIEAVKNRRILETLKERDLLKKRRREFKEEIAFLDEIASKRWQMRSS